jgi:hypothetical protein
MDNSSHRLNVCEADHKSRSLTARHRHLHGLRGFLRTLWPVNTGRHTLTEDCLRCGYPVVSGMYCFHCGYVRPRTTKRRFGEGALVEWFFRAR